MHTDECEPMRRRVTVVVRSCRRGCGKSLTGLSGPLHGTTADFRRFHGICDDCLTDEEKAEMRGPMLMRTAKRIVGRAT